MVIKDYKIQLEGDVNSKLNELCFLTFYFVVNVTSLFSAKFIEAYSYASFSYRKPSSGHGTKSFLIVVPTDP